MGASSNEITSSINGDGSSKLGSTSNFFPFNQIPLKQLSIR